MYQMRVRQFANSNYYYGVLHPALDVEMAQQTFRFSGRKSVGRSKLRIFAPTFLSPLARSIRELSTRINIEQMRTAGGRAARQVHRRSCVSATFTTRAFLYTYVLLCTCTGRVRVSVESPTLVLLVLPFCTGCFKNNWLEF